VFTSHRSIDLAEIGKDQRQMFGGDSDPGVLNRNIKDGAVAQQLRGADAQFDGAAIREFDRVVEQVQNNLPDAAEIAHHAPAGNA
jgi:hypothetical protein